MAASPPASWLCLPNLKGLISDLMPQELGPKVQHRKQGPQASCKVSLSRGTCQQTGAILPAEEALPREGAFVGASGDLLGQ